MANTLRFKRGLVATIPTAALGEPLFTTDTFDLYIGNGTTNTRFQKYIASGTTSQLLRGDGSLLTMPIVLTSPANGQVLKYDGTNWVNSADAGVTGSGTAGQVTYWGSSSTITGSNNLFWDATNNRLGIGTNTPTVILDVAGASNLASRARFEKTGTTKILQFGADRDTSLLPYIGSESNHGFSIITNNTERARFDASGNLGLGTASPLVVAGYTTLAVNNATNGANIDLMTAGTRHASWNNTATETYFGTRSNTPLAFTTNATEVARFYANGNFRIGGNAADAGFKFDVNGTSRLNGVTSIIGSTTSAYISTIRQTNTTADVSFGLLVTAGTSANDIAFRVQNAAQNTNFFTVLGNGDSNFSNNLGLGVTPSAWNTSSTYKAIDVSNSFSLLGGGGAADLYFNLFFNASSQFIYKANGFGSAYSLATGQHRWYTAASGTAGAVATLTQPMTLTANGRLLLGTTTEGTQRLQVAGDVKFDADAATNGFYWDNTNKRLGIGTNAPRTRVGIELSGATAPSTVVNTTGFDNTYTTFGNVDLVSGSQFAIGVSQTGTTGTYLISAAPTSEWTDISYYGRNNIFFGGGTERMRIDANGSVGIGSTSLTGYSLRVNKIITGAANAYGVSSDGIVQSDVTGQAFGFNTSLGTQAASFTLPILSHYRADQSTFGAGSAVTTQYGFQVRSNLIGATNNYGFFGDIASGTGRWNLFMNGSANNYMAGSVGIGQTTLTGSNLRISKPHTGSTSAINFYIDSTIQSDVTNSPKIIATTLSTQAAAFTIPIVSHFYANQGTIGAGSTVTTQIGFQADNTLVGGTINYGFYGNIPSGTNRWNFYGAGSAANYFNGNVLLGSTTDSGEKLQVTGTMKVTGASSIDGNTFNVDATNDRVGIGTASPATKLEIVGATGLQIRNAAADGFSFQQSTTNSWSWTPLTSGSKYNIQNADVGIGTATPDAKLRVAGTVNGTQAIFANLDGRGLAISTSVIGGTNEAGVVLNARSSVSSGTFIFQTDGTQRMQLDSSGLTISGGNGYEVINSAATTVTALRPTGGGSSIMSTNSNGLHIAVGTEADGDLILASNNTERIRLSSNGFFSQLNATNPSASITDSYIQYSADVVAGNAAPHFRTENGAVVKLYQETTGVGNAIFSQGGGNAVLDDSTFDGYTLRQIVKALRNQGILQ